MMMLVQKRETWHLRRVKSRKQEDSEFERSVLERMRNNHQKRQVRVYIYVQEEELERSEL